MESFMVDTGDNNESKTNIIVNYLPQTLTYDELKQLFTRYGELESCKLVCDKLTGQSLCYGFVNFVNIEDAAKAARELNGIKLQNKVIKVSFARPSCESIKGANLYVCGLPKSWTTKEFNQYFSQCGKIITSRILLTPTNQQSKGVGFIRFDQRYEAELAIQRLNGSLPIVFGNEQLDPTHEPLIVKFANFSDTEQAINFQPMPAFYAPSQQTYRPATAIAYNYPTAIFTKSTTDLTPTITAAAAAATTPLPPGTGWCLFVYNLSPETEDNILWQLFGPFGAVQNIKLIRDFQNRKCKGFGFVTMTNYEEAVMAINTLNGFNLGNRILQVSFKKNNQTF